MNINAVSVVIVQAALATHQELGPGQGELYASTLARKLLAKGLSVDRRQGFLVENQVHIELRSPRPVLVIDFRALRLPEGLQLVVKRSHSQP